VDDELARDFHLSLRVRQRVFDCDCEQCMVTPDSYPHTVVFLPTVGLRPLWRRCGLLQFCTPGIRTGDDFECQTYAVASGYVQCELEYTTVHVQKREVFVQGSLVTGSLQARAGPARPEFATGRTAPPRAMERDRYFRRLGGGYQTMMRI